MRKRGLFQNSPAKQEYTKPASQGSGNRFFVRPVLWLISLPLFRLPLRFPLAASLNVLQKSLYNFIGPHSP